MKSVTVLLSTYNGEKYLHTQLNSLSNQTIKFNLIIRDDGSKDNTINIIKSWKNKLKFKLIKGENIGVINSFFELLKYNDIDSDYIAFCDQDDIWDSNKLEEGIKSIELNSKTNIPNLYHSNLKLINEDGIFLNKYFWKSMNITPIKSHKINRLLCQPIVTGCTCIINKSLYLKFLSHPTPKNVKMHDWWLSLIACCFGKIISDERSFIEYRLHQSNVIGAEIDILKKIFKNLKNIKKYISSYKKEVKERIFQAQDFKNIYADEIDTLTLKTLNKYITCVDSNFFIKKIIQFKYKFYQQGLLRNIISFFLF